jgi:predicted naringenin-chalcone synthase
MCNPTMKHSESDISLATASDADTPEYRKYQVRKSKLIGLVSWTHVIGTYMPQFILCGLGVLVALIFNQVIVDLMEKEHIARDFDVTSLPTTIMATFAAIADLLVRQVTSIMSLRKEALFSPAVEGTVLALIIMVWMIRSDNPTYLLSFATFKAPESWRASHDEIIEMMRRQDVFTEDSLGFMRRLLDRSGTGQRTAWPPGITRSLHEKDENGKPLKSDRSIGGSRQEAHTVIFDIVEKAMKKANITPQEVDVLVINCSLFSPTPSLCAAVIAHFQMRGDILSYNLSGMGCGASLLALDLGKNMLQRRKWGGKALVVSTEIITPNLYLGNERGFLVQNTLFRCGGSAMVISNKWMDGSRAWFKLLHSVRVQSTNEDGYQCVFETEDGDGLRGVRLSKDIVKVAGKTMEKNLTRLGPYVLPLSEQAKVAISLIAKFVMKTLGKIVGKKLASVKIYVPDFKRGIDHFCIHAGGRAVIDGIEKNMKLEKYHTEPSRMTLMNYGNTSSSSIWYELEYIMEHQKNNPLKKGDRVMQVAFGSGFKCCSGVWLKL